MTPEQVTLVQESFAKVAPSAEQVAELFYSRLFDLEPSLRTLFKGDIKDQGKKLMGVLTIAVAGLTDIDKLVPVVESLGRRHGDYGVKNEDYATVGRALIWTLEQGRGESFTDDTKNAWLEVYGILSSVMQEAAAKAA